MVTDTESRSRADRTRRLLLAASVGGLLLPAVPALAAAPPATPHDPFGPVLPRQPAPAVQLLDADGKGGSLVQRLRGRITAVQLMFTGCSTTCPIQGALFADLRGRLPAPGMQLLSLSIDPLSDDPAALAAWLHRFGDSDVAGPWTAAAPRVQDVDRLLVYLAGGPVAPAGRSVDRHTGQVYLFDRQGRLAYRTPELPTSRHVADLLGELARIG